MRLTPDYKQYLAWQLLQDHEHNWILYGGGKGGGKSYLSVMWIVSMCYQYPDTKWVVGRKELKSIRESWYATFRKFLRDQAIPANDWKFNSHDNTITLMHNQSQIIFLEMSDQPSDPMFETFGSKEFTGGVLEEAGEVSSTAFETLKTLVGRWRNKEYNILPKLLVTANPKKNWLYNHFWKPYADGTIKAPYAFVQALAHDNSHLDDSYLKILDEISDPVMRERLLRGNWEYESTAGCIFKTQMVDAMFMADYIQPNADSQYYLTIDVARFGSDKAFFMVWQDWIMIRYEEIASSDLHEVVNRGRLLRDYYNIPFDNIIADEAGVGGGVIDFMPCIGFVGARAAVMQIDNNTKFKNIRSQCFYKLSDKINNYAVRIADERFSAKYRDRTIQEAENILEKNPENDGSKQIISKEEIKKKIGYSCDILDCMSMRAWFDINSGGQINCF